MKHLLFKCLPAWVLAVLITAVLTSVVQSLANLQALQAMGVALEPVHWVETVALDLVGFGAFMAVVTAPTFLVAFMVAAVLLRWIPSRGFVFAVAGALGMLGVVMLLDHLTPPPTLIAATRTWVGTGLFMACAGVGGLLYGLLSRFRDPDLIFD